MKLKKRDELEGKKTIEFRAMALDKNGKIREKK